MNLINDNMSHFKDNKSKQKSTPFLCCIAFGAFVVSNDVGAAWLADEATRSLVGEHSAVLSKWVFRLNAKHISVSCACVDDVVIHDDDADDFNKDRPHQTNDLHNHRWCVVQFDNITVAVTGGRAVGRANGRKRRFRKNFPKKEFSS